MSLPKTIETARCLLRAPQPADAEAVFAAYAADPEVARYVDWAPHVSAEQTRQWISYESHRAAKRSNFIWMIVPREGSGSGGAVGHLQLTPQSFERGRPVHHLRIGYLLARARWGQGLMTEAAGALLRAAFGDAQVWRVDALCDTANVASARVLEKIGMQREGTLRRCAIHPHAGAEPRDVWIYAAVR